MFKSLDDDGLGGGGLHEGGGLESPIWRCELGLFTILLEVLKHLGFWGLYSLSASLRFLFLLYISK